MTDKQRYDQIMAQIGSETNFNLPCYFDELEPILKLVWDVQQSEINSLRSAIKEGEITWLL